MNNFMKELSILKSKKKIVYNTGDSQVVTHQGSNPARHRLTSVIRQELVLSVCVTKTNKFNVNEQILEKSKKIKKKEGYNTGYF